MAFDFKKEYKEFYLPKNRPSIVKLPPLNYLAVRGHGDPNAEDGEYKRSIGLLYAIAFTLKMSYKTPHKIPGFFEYVVPPLEGLWWQDSAKQDDAKSGTIDYRRKADLNFISMIRLPDFITPAEFDWAIATATEKKQQDFSAVEFFNYAEGTCVQCMHLGPYDDEPATIQLMHDFATEQHYALDIQNPRYHHEIYLSDLRKCQPANLKTVIRHPVRLLA